MVTFPTTDAVSPEESWLVLMRFLFMHDIRVELLTDWDQKFGWVDSWFWWPSKGFGLTRMYVATHCTAERPSGNWNPNRQHIFYSIQYIFSWSSGPKMVPYAWCYKPAPQHSAPTTMLKYGNGSFFYKAKAASMWPDSSSLVSSVQRTDQQNG